MWIKYDTASSQNKLLLCDEQVHSGDYSLKLDTYAKFIRIPNENMAGKVVEIYFYDNEVKYDTLGVLIGFQWDANYYGVGVRKNMENYAFRKTTNGDDYSWYDTGIARIAGWHRLTYDMSDGQSLTVSIDGELLFTQDDFTPPAEFAVIDNWSGSDNASNMYIDDFTVTEP